MESGWVQHRSMTPRQKGLLHNYGLLKPAALFDSKPDSEWEQWKKTYKKTYLNEEEEASRRELWEQNLKLINKHNLEASMGLHTYKLSMNHMGDLRPEEMGCFIPPTDNQRTPSTFTATSDTAVPDSIDRREKGYVTKAKGRCRSYWAFSAVGALEGQLFKKTRRPVDLSPQNLVDCSSTSKYGNRGCKDSYIDKALQYVMDNQDIDSDASYPYTGRASECHYNPSYCAATCSDYIQLPKGNKEALKQALGSIGPISVSVNSQRPGFKFYKSVYNDPSYTQKVDHAVLAVGYGTLNGQDYWLVKNRYGSNWGEEGYILMARNKDNQCGIALYAFYPTM